MLKPSVRKYYFSYGILKASSLDYYEMMEFSKLTAKYQTTIPKSIRNQLNLKPGDYVQFQELNGQIIINKVEAIDSDYLQAVGTTLESEWLSDADEEAYANL